jgi:crotonobetainyl-CoA:carnitine CoA-transferase CaiB-like acyl-CoA transferase
MKPLAHLKVIDLTTVISGPYTASLLADLGAHVIKVEPPGGEAARAFASADSPFTLGGMSPHILTLQRNKKGVVIDLRNPEGKAVFDDLVRWADVVVENYRPGVTERLGIDYPRLKALNRGVIMCSITGYGLTGPARDRAALDACIQAYSGVMGITGEPDGEPMRAGPIYGDLCSGMAGAVGVLAALAARERTGEGQHVDISMLDVQISMLSYTATMHLMTGLPSERAGNEHTLHVPYNSYPTADGYLFMAVVIPSHWPVFIKALQDVGLPPELDATLAWLSDPRLGSRDVRLRERAAVNEAVAAILKARPRAAWMEAFGRVGLAFAPVNTVEEALADPQLAARHMVVETTHPNGTPYRMPGNPIKLSGFLASEESFSSPPTLGQHTAEVLAGVLGYDGTRIAGLLASGAVAGEQEVGA